ncbi:hypothetical protein QYE76_021755 [Lolium multiflorum]|uniref:F-box domain-containing protein n=1 Tax=Lolium multiflorum TaxID=4521 RepID=A0AAD8R738_LOLMU|nr:hypothetical protein QYE76_021755 [Lolium multiflorum]
MATTSTTAFLLPRDILSSILIRLPGRDLRRLRRICKEWRDIIFDPTFIQSHMVYKPKLPPAHTIVFFPGFTYGSRQDPRNGRGFLFDEHWRLTAELTACRWDDLIGACNGLLCFLQAGQGSIRIIEPFTGESLTLPLPLPKGGSSSSRLSYRLRRTMNPSSYCFGFDATHRRYKVVHHNSHREFVVKFEKEEVQVYTVGGGEGWTRVHAAHGEAYGDAVHVDGSVYWPSSTYRGEDKLVRLDLAMEKITLEAAVRLRLDAPRRERALFCRLEESTPTPCVMTYDHYCEWDTWFPQAEEGGGVGCFPGGRMLLSLSKCVDHGLYLRRIESSLEFGQGMLLFEEHKHQPPSYGYNGRASFVPARPHRQLPVTRAPPTSELCYVRLSQVPCKGMINLRQDEDTMTKRYSNVHGNYSKAHECEEGEATFAKSVLNTEELKDMRSQVDPTEMSALKKNIYKQNSSFKAPSSTKQMELIDGDSTKTTTIGATMDPK